MRRRTLLSPRINRLSFLFALCYLSLFDGRGNFVLLYAKKEHPHKAGAEVERRAKVCAAHVIIVLQNIRIKALSAYARSLNFTGTPFVRSISATAMKSSRGSCARWTGELPVKRSLIKTVKAAGFT